MAGHDPQPYPPAPGVFGTLLRSGSLPSLEANLGRHCAMPFCTCSSATRCSCHMVCQLIRIQTLIQLPLNNKAGSAPEVQPQAEGLQSQRRVLEAEGVHTQPLLATSCPSRQHPRAISALPPCSPALLLTDLGQSCNSEHQFPHLWLRLGPDHL